MNLLINAVLKYARLYNRTSNKAQSLEKGAEEPDSNGKYNRRFLTTTTAADIHSVSEKTTLSTPDRKQTLSDVRNFR